MFRIYPKLQSGIQLSNQLKKKVPLLLAFWYTWIRTYMFVYIDNHSIIF